MKINKTHKIPQKNIGKIGGIRTKPLVPELLTNPGCWEKYQMNAMAIFYDPKVSYTNKHVRAFGYQDTSHYVV